MGNADQDRRQPESAGCADWFSTLPGAFPLNSLHDGTTPATFCFVLEGLARGPIVLVSHGRCMEDLGVTCQCLAGYSKAA